MGSNTLRAVAIDTQSLERMEEYEKITRTAQNLHQSHKISQEAQKRVIDAINEARAKMPQNAPYKAVATEALRKAENSREFLERIKEECGIAFEIIDGEQEAYYTSIGVLAVARRLGIEGGCLIVDLGGGSTEVIRCSTKYEESKSFGVGIVNMAERFRGMERLRAGIVEELGPLREYIRTQMAEGDIRTLISTAGTPTTVAALKQGMDYQTYDYRKIDGTRINKEDFQQAKERLLGSTQAERERLVGVGRGDLIVAWIEIFLSILEATGFDASVVIDEGLREGAAISIV